ncbi:MAG: N-acetylornithine carbamoyltransferase [Balneolaceae bacterium]|nr:N-acetylornithine carbamoyltransferase [Balneolaceae bacterium]
MKQFLSINDVPDLNGLLDKALNIKANLNGKRELGKHKSIGLIFLNPSLRTRLSSQRAALNLGMDAIVLDVNSGGWKLEFDDGVIMNGDSAEHVKEAAGVLGRYFDVLAIRSFAALEDREKDYEDAVLNAFAEYSGVPIINMESATGHPLQAFADLITITEHQKKSRPKVVLSWAPHPKALPQAVANSFVRWMKASNVDLMVTHPNGYELADTIMEGVSVEYDQNIAFDNADFIYAKNWSSYTNYGKVLSSDSSWMITQEKMNLTNNAKFLHCLPVRRNVVVEDAVLDSTSSIVLDQAENRIVSMQTVLESLLEELK